ncbi:MAG: 50S ribosomal protein L6 [Alphaproteobacteria bacterium]
MSRVGKYPVKVPQNVTVSLENNVITAKGKLGQLSYQFEETFVNVSIVDGTVVVKPLSETKKGVSLWGTTRARINTLCQGVDTGFFKDLELIGVGYKARMEGKKLIMSLGFSHDITFESPEGITIACVSPTQLKVSGADKQLVGQVAAEIRKYRKPEPYKGKGVRYSNEYVRRKEGKKK